MNIREHSRWACSGSCCCYERPAWNDRTTASADGSLHQEYLEFPSSCTRSNLQKKQFARHLILVHSAANVTNAIIALIQLVKLLKSIICGPASHPPPPFLPSSCTSLASSPFPAPIRTFRIRQATPSEGRRCHAIESGEVGPGIFDRLPTWWLMAGGSVSERFPVG